MTACRASTTALSVSKCVRFRDGSRNQPPGARPSDHAPPSCFGSIRYSIGGATPIARAIAKKSSLGISKLPRLNCMPNCRGLE